MTCLLLLLSLLSSRGCHAYVTPTSVARRSQPRVAARSALGDPALHALHSGGALLSVDARAALVRSVLAAPELLAASEAPLQPPRWLCNVATSAACAAAFPHTFAAVREWHSQRERLATWELEATVRRVLRILSAELPAGSFRIESRVKSVSSLFEKVWLRGKPANDLLALRIILADAPREAYAISPTDRPHRRCLEAREMLTRVWEETSFRDYIERPKPNGYASLHSLLRLGSGASLEVQIRTEAMHAVAESGAAAHAQYKVDAMGAAAARMHTSRGPGVALAVH